MDPEKAAENIMSKHWSRTAITQMLEDCYSIDPRALENDTLAGILIKLEKDEMTPEDALAKAEDVYNLWDTTPKKEDNL